MTELLQKGGFSVGPRLAGPQVDHWIPLLEKVIIVLACLSY